MARKKKRGVSLGTYVLTILCMLTIFMGAVIYTRISGDIDQISLNPKILTEPLEMLRPTATDAQQAPGAAGNDQAAALTTAPPLQIEPPERMLTINAVGQVTIGDDIRRSVRVDGGYDFSSIFNPIAYALTGGDLNIATLRTLVTDDSTRYDAYHAPGELLAGMKANGFSLFNLATDHILDDGIEGIEKSRSILQSSQVTAAGAYISSDERDSLPVREINGVRVGVLSYTNSVGAGGRKVSENIIQMSTRMLDLESAKADIIALRQKGAQVIIVLAYWGSRTDTKASKDTRAIAEALVNAGADIILGTNPTQVHEIERRTVVNSDGSLREAFIAYSLGNFLVDDTRESANITGLMLSLSLTYNTQTRNLTIQDAWYMPTWIMRWKDQSDQNRYRIVPAGASAPPMDMTRTVHGNMNKSFESTVKKLDPSAARVRAE